MSAPKAKPAKPPIKAIPDQPEIPQEIKTPTQLVVLLFNALNALKEIPEGHTALDMRNIGNAVEGLLRGAGVIRK